MNRADLARERLIELFSNENFSLVLLSEQEYDELPLKPAFRYGWVPPVRLADHHWVGQVCVDRLVAAGDGIEDDEDFLAYLWLVEFSMMQHVVMADEIPDPLQRHQAIEDLLYAESPDMVHLVSRSQMAMLDAGAR